MAVDALGIYPNEQGTVIGTSKRIDANAGTVTEYVRFKTQGNGWHSANVWVEVSVIKKNGNEAMDGFTYIGEAGKLEIARSSFTSVSGSASDGYVWAYPFSSIDGSPTLASLIGTLSFSGRSYDCIKLHVMVRCYWDSDKVNEKSSKIEQDCYIGFIPAYTVTGAYYDKNGLSIEYTTSNWGRQNDRWQVTNLKDGTKVVCKSASGTVKKAGLLTIPKKLLTYIPKDTDVLKGNLSFRGSWQSDKAQALQTVTVNQAVDNRYTVRAVTLTVTPSAAGVTATVNEVSSAASPNDYIEVSMVGGIYDSDRAQIPVGGSHLFTGVPYGVATEWQAVGYSSAAGELAMSQPVTATAAAIDSSHASISTTDTEADDFATLDLPYNITVSSSHDPETSVVKLAGRQRPTVGYGEGGTAQWTIGGIVLTKQPVTGAGLSLADMETLRRLPETGPVMLRLPDGSRANLRLSTSFSRMQDNMYSVTLTGEEVS